MRKFNFSRDVELNELESEVAESQGLSLVIPRRYEVDFNKADRPYRNRRYFKKLEDEFDWQITYKFTDKVRKYIFSSGRYGSKNMTIRRLYLILVSMNNGVSFVDDYLVNVLPYTDLGKEIRDYALNATKAFEDEYAETVRIKEDGTVDKRYYNRSHKFRLMVDKTMKTEAQRLEKLLKADFISALESGRVPLHTTMLSKETIARKEKLGFSFSAKKFVASEQFVKDIIFYVRLEKKKWQIADIWV